MFLRNVIIDKISPNVLFCRPFSTTFDSDWKSFYTTSEAIHNCIWVIDWGSVGHDGSRRYGRGYSGTQLEHSTRASSTTERESISITLADIACVVAVQQQLCATKTNSRQAKKQSNGCSDDDGRKQLVLRESESYLMVQRPGKPLRSSSGGFAFISLSSKSWWRRLIAQPGMDHSFVSWSSKSDFCSVFPDSPMKKNQNHHKMAHGITMWWDFFTVENPTSFRFQSQK